MWLDQLKWTVNNGVYIFFFLERLHNSYCQFFTIHVKQFVRWCYKFRAKSHITLIQQEWHNYLILSHFVHNP